MGAAFQVIVDGKQLIRQNCGRAGGRTKLSFPWLDGRLFFFFSAHHSAKSREKGTIVCSWAHSSPITHRDKARGLCLLPHKKKENETILLFVGS